MVVAWLDVTAVDRGAELVAERAAGLWPRLVLALASRPSSATVVPRFPPVPLWPRRLPPPPDALDGRDARASRRGPQPCRDPPLLRHRLRRRCGC